MAINKENLLLDVKTFVGVGDNTWNQDRMGAGPTKKLVEYWLQDHIDYVAGISWSFMQRHAKTSGLTINTAAGDRTISLSDDGLFIELPETITMVNCGKVGDAFISPQRLDDIMLEQYEDGGDRVFASLSYLRNDEKSIPILLFTEDKTDSDVHLIITEHPERIENFPQDFSRLFKKLLIKDALMMEGSANSGGILQMLVKEIPDILKDLKSKYASKLEPVLMKQNQHEQRYRDSMIGRSTGR